MGNSSSIADGDLSSAKVAGIGGCYYKNNIIYFTDRSSVRRLDLNTNKVSTLADGRNRTGIVTPRDGKGGSVIVAQPGAITGDEEGNLYFLDRTNLYENECSKKVGNYIRKISPPDKAISKPNIISKGTFTQDSYVCFSPIKIELYNEGQRVLQTTTIVYPDTAINNSVTKTFEIKNIGGYYISFQKNPIMNFINPQNSFTFSNIVPNEVPPGGSGFYTVTFSPKVQFGNFSNISLVDSVNGYWQIGYNLRGNGF
jgi:hypothetical protein